MYVAIHLNSHIELYMIPWIQVKIDRLFENGPDMKSMLANLALPVSQLKCILFYFIRLHAQVYMFVLLLFLSYCQNWHNCKTRDIYDVSLAQIPVWHSWSPEGAVVINCSACQPFYVKYYLIFIAIVLFFENLLTVTVYWLYIKMSVIIYIL